MKRKQWLFAVLAFAMAGSVLTAQAESLNGGSGWGARFTGDDIESNFTSSQIADAVSGLQPGDDITFRVDVENGDDRNASFYMTNEVLSSLEESQNAAQGGAYGYHLVYTGPGGAETVLYDSDAVGGDSTARGEGLHKVSNSLEDYLYLDTLTPGQKGTVSLKASLDGETQGNGYQNTFANLQINFAVEPDADNENPGGENPGGGNPGGGGNTPGTGRGTGGGNPGGGSGSALYTQDRVYTGDNDRILIWSSVALVSGLGLLIYAVFCHRKKQGREES